MRINLRVSKVKSKIGSSLTNKNNLQNKKLFLLFLMKFLLIIFSLILLSVIIHQNITSKEDVFGRNETFIIH